MKHIVSFNIPPYLHLKLIEEAKSRLISASALLRQILQERYESEIAVQENEKQKVTADEQTVVKQ